MRAARREALSLRDGLRLESYQRILADFSSWRIDDLLRAEKERSAGILGFVRGLKLSAQIIYAIREPLRDRGLQAHWGHLLDPDGRRCSRECDIIIHAGGVVRQWNGHGGEPVMDFCFVDCSQARCVISCKSFMRSIDTQYCQDLHPYVKHVMLFAECCPSGSVARLRSQADGAGYTGFWHLYTWNRRTGMTQSNELGWQEFIRVLEGLQ